MLCSLNRPDILVVTLAAAGILMVTMGARQSLGLFIAPIGATTGLGIASISLALAIGQFTWGAIQPVAGAVADRYGPRAVLIGGLVLLALGSAVTPFMGTGFGLMVSSIEKLISDRPQPSRAIRSPGGTNHHHAPTWKAFCWAA